MRPPCPCQRPHVSPCPAAFTSLPLPLELPVCRYTLAPSAWDTEVPGGRVLWLVPPGSASWAFLLDLERRWGCAEKGAKNNEDLRWPLSSGSQSEVPRPAATAAPRSLLKACALGVGPASEMLNHRPAVVLQTWDPMASFYNKHLVMPYLGFPNGTSDK